MMEAPAQILVCTPESAKGEAVRQYAQYLRGLLGGRICYEPMLSKEDGGHIRQASTNCDLIVFGEPEQSWLETLLTGRSCDRAVANSSTSILLARQPRWPIKHILLVLRIVETDEAAAAWLAHLVQPGETAVTILPLVPSLPVMYSLGNRVQTGLDVLLSPDTPSGNFLRYVAQGNDRGSNARGTDL